jgi:ferredoxin
MPVLKADLSLCQGYANCVVAADDAFDIGDDGMVVLLRASFPESDRARLEAAARSCPAAALTVASG